MRKHHSQTSAVLEKPPLQEYSQSNRRSISQAIWIKQASKLDHPIKLVFVGTFGRIADYPPKLKTNSYNWNVPGFLLSQEIQAGDQFLVLQLD